PVDRHLGDRCTDPRNDPRRDARVPHPGGACRRRRLRDDLPEYPADPHHHLLPVRSVPDARHQAGLRVVADLPGGQQLPTRCARPERLHGGVRVRVAPLGHQHGLARAVGGGPLAGPDLQPESAPDRPPPGFPRGHRPARFGAHRVDQELDDRLRHRRVRGLAADEDDDRERSGHLRRRWHLRARIRHPHPSHRPALRPAQQAIRGRPMSAHGTVLYDAPGPRAKALYRILSVVVVALLVLVGWIVYRALDANGQLTAAKWEPFVESSSWTTYLLPGIRGTIIAAVASIVLALVLGTVLGIARLS